MPAPDDAAYVSCTQASVPSLAWHFLFIPAWIGIVVQTLSGIREGVTSAEVLGRIAFATMTACFTGCSLRIVVLIIVELDHNRGAAALRPR